MMMAFQADELRMREDTIAEQIRTREIFEVLKSKAIKREKLTEHEKDFFCLGVKISNRNDGSWENYPCCDNYKFKNLYLTYFSDSTGGSPYYKVNRITVYN